MNLGCPCALHILTLCIYKYNLMMGHKLTNVFFAQRKRINMSIQKICGIQVSIGLEAYQEEVDPYVHDGQMIFYPTVDLLH